MDTIGPWVQVIVPLLLTGVMGLIAWSFNRLYRQTEERQRRTEDDVREIKRDYALKEDVVREGASTRQKLDLVVVGLSELKGKQDVTHELVHALTARLRQAPPPGSGDGLDHE